MRKLFLAVGMLGLFATSTPASADEGFGLDGMSEGTQTVLKSDAAVFQFDTDLETERTVSSSVIQVHRETLPSHYIFAAVSSLLVLTLRGRKSRGSETPTHA